MLNGIAVDRHQARDRTLLELRDLCRPLQHRFLEAASAARCLLLPFQFLTHVWATLYQPAVAPPDLWSLDWHDEVLDERRWTSVNMKGVAYQAGQSIVHVAEPMSLYFVLCRLIFPVMTAVRKTWPHCLMKLRDLTQLSWPMMMTTVTRHLGSSRELRRPGKASTSRDLVEDHSVTLQLMCRMLRLIMRIYNRSVSAIAVS